MFHIQLYGHSQLLQIQHSKIRMPFHSMMTNCQTHVAIMLSQQEAVAQKKQGFTS